MKKNYPFLSEILTLLKRNDYGTNEEYTIRAAKTGWTRKITSIQVGGQGTLRPKWDLYFCNKTLQDRK